MKKVLQKSFILSLSFLFMGIGSDKALAQNKSVEIIKPWRSLEYNLVGNQYDILRSTASKELLNEKVWENPNKDSSHVDLVIITPKSKGFGKNYDYDEFVRVVLSSNSRLGLLPKWTVPQLFKNWWVKDSPKLVIMCTEKVVTKKGYFLYQIGIGGSHSFTSSSSRGYKDVIMVPVGNQRNDNRSEFAFWLKSE